MELKWIEDFLSLADTGNFSRSAQIRHVTQPAFSRRIQALENWLGDVLVDRTSYPTRLTAAGEQFRTQAISIMQEVLDARASLRGQRPIPPDTISFAAPHALALNFYPKWLAQLERDCFDHTPISTRLNALNVHDAVMALVEGNCDVLMCYHHPEQPVQLDPNRYAMLTLGLEGFRPYSKATKSAGALFSFPGTASKTVPYLAYSPNAFLGRMVEIILRSARRTHHLRRRYETDMAEALKTMAMEGHGIAWLPDSAVAREVKAHQLVAVGGSAWAGEMEIRLYRERERNKPVLEKLWAHLETPQLAAKRGKRKQQSA